MRFFFYKHSLKSILQFGIKNVICHLPARSMFTTRRSKRLSFLVQVNVSVSWATHHESLILAKLLSHDRALSFLFTAFLYSISCTLKIVIKSNICQRKVCLWTAQKRPNGRHCSTATRCAEPQHKSLLLAGAKDPLWNLWFGVFKGWFDLIFQFN